MSAYRYRYLPLGRRAGLASSVPRADIIAHLLRMDAVGIERRHWIATLLLDLVDDRAKPQRRVVNPLWRIELPTDEGERIEEAGHERGANMVRALHQAIFMADTSIEQHAMDELRALIPIARILIADLEIDAQTQEARRVPLDDGGGIVGCPIVFVDRIAVNLS